MPASRLALVLIAALLLGAGMLVLMAGNPIPLLVAAAGMLVAGLMRPSPGGSASAWISTVGAVAIFIAGTPLMGSRPEGLLITAAMAIYFICWVQQVKMAPVNVPVPVAPFTLGFYATLMLAYLLMRSRLWALPHVAGLFVASLFILISLALWELGRRSRLSQASQLQSPSLPDWLGRVFVLIAVLLVTFLLFRLPLPWIANTALDVAASMDLTADASAADRRPDPDGRSRGGADLPTPPRPGEGAGPGDGRPGMEDYLREGDGHPWSRGALPDRANLQLSDEARFHLELPHPGRAQREGDRPIYLRLHTFSLFEEGVWKRADHVGRWIADAEDGEPDGWVTFNAAPADRVAHQRVYLYNYLPGAPLPCIPNVLAFQGERVFREGDDFFSLQQAGDIVYEVASAPLDYRDVMDRRELEPGEAPPHYLEKPQGLAFRDMDNVLLAPIAGQAIPLKDKLAYLTRLFSENYRYTERVENPAGREPLANFLFHEKKGYCDFFAQAGAHLARRIGVPSRVAYGYAGGLYDPVDHLHTFRQRDAHAWTEIFLKDLGWIVFDLTPEGEGPRRAPQTERTGNADVADPLRRFRQKETEADPIVSENDPFPRDRSTLPELERWLEGLWILRYLDLLLGATVVVLLGAYLYRRWRQRGRNGEEGEDGRAVRGYREPPGYFRDFCELFEDLGCRRSSGETLREYFTELKDRELLGEEFDPLLEYHYRVQYENWERSRAAEKGFSKQIREFRRSHPLASAA